jgi:hypothetical protein
MTLIFILVLCSSIAILVSTIWSIRLGIVPRAMVVRTFCLAVMCIASIICYMIFRVQMLIEGALILGVAGFLSANEQRRRYAQEVFPRVAQDLQEKVARRRAGLEPYPPSTAFDEFGRRIVSFFMNVPYKGPLER